MTSAVSIRSRSRWTVIAVAVAIGTSASTWAALAGTPRHQSLLQYKLDHQRRIQTAPSGIVKKVPVPSTPAPPADNLQILTCPPEQGQCGGAPVPFSEVLFSPTTQWTTLVGSDYLFIWAGASTLNTQQGGIKVLYLSTDTGEAGTGSGVFYAPAATGALTITSVSGNVVSFSYAGGNGTFNVATDQFALTSGG